MHPNIEIFDQTLQKYDGWFDLLLATVPPPQQVPFGDSFVYRFLEKSPQQAIVQKLARYIVGLRAAHLLLLNGLVQDQGAIQRVIDEAGEDVSFLASGLINEWTELHALFLEQFNAEDYSG